MTDAPRRPQSDWHLPVSNFSELVRPITSTKPEAVAERKRQALNQHAMGRNKSHIARELGISRRTINQWLTVDPSFKEQWERVASERDELLAEEFEELAFNIARGTVEVENEDGSKSVKQYTKDGMPNYSAVRDGPKVTNRERWGDKKEITHGGTIVHTVIPMAKRLDELSDGDVIDVPVVERDEEDE